MYGRQRDRVKLQIVSEFHSSSGVLISIDGDNCFSNFNVSELSVVLFVSVSNNIFNSG